MKRYEAPHKGLDASDKLFIHYKELLQLLGHGNLLMDKTKDSSHDVPVKCEQTNKRVAELLKSMTLQISEMKQAYHICKEDLDKNKSVLESMKNFDSLPEKIQVDKSPEYQSLRKALQSKNEDLKKIIDEVREMFVVINRLAEI